MTCHACGDSREPSELIAFYPVGRPDLARFVCAPRDRWSCFARCVRTADVHRIQAATEYMKEFPR